MQQLISTGSQQFTELTQIILTEAKRLGASAAEVQITTNRGFTVTVRNKDVETVEYRDDKSIGITVYFDKKSGSVHLSDMRLPALHNAVAAACNIARFTDNDPASGLPDS